MFLVYTTLPDCQHQFPHLFSAEISWFRDRLRELWCDVPVRELSFSWNVRPLLSWRLCTTNSPVLVWVFANLCGWEGKVCWGRERDEVYRGGKEFTSWSYWDYLWQVSPISALSSLAESIKYSFCFSRFLLGMQQLCEIASMQQIQGRVVCQKLLLWWRELGFWVFSSGI